MWPTGELNLGLTVCRLKVSTRDKLSHNGPWSMQCLLGTYLVHVLLLTSNVEC